MDDKAVMMMMCHENGVSGCSTWRS